MTAPNTVILCAPAEWIAREGMEALLERFGCEQVIDEWNPRCAHVAGALHITSMRPEALFKFLQFNKPWLVSRMHSRGWTEQRQRVVDMRQKETRRFIQALAVIGFFIVALGVVGPAIDGRAEPQPARHGELQPARSVHRDELAWTDRRGQQQLRTVITVVHGGSL